MSKLTAKDKKILTAASEEAPVVAFGKQGINEAALGHLEKSLADHELVKLRIAKGLPIADPEWESKLVAILTDMGAVIIRKVGKTLLVYKEPAKPKKERKFNFGPARSV